MAELFGSDDDNTIVGTMSDDTIQGLGGNDTIDLGQGQDTVVIEPDDGHDRISGFTSGDDTLTLSNFTTIDSYQDLVPFTSTTNGTTMIDVSAAAGGLPGGQTLTFIDTAGIAEGDVEFADIPPLPGPPRIPDFETFERLGQEPTDPGPSGPIERTFTILDRTTGPSIDRPNFEWTIRPSIDREHFIVGVQDDPPPIF
jgi:hypothetical protein